MLLCACALFTRPMRGTLSPHTHKSNAARVSHPCIPRLTPHRRLAPILSYSPLIHDHQPQLHLLPLLHRRPDPPTPLQIDLLEESFMAIFSTLQLNWWCPKRAPLSRHFMRANHFFDRGIVIIGQGDCGSSISSFLPWWDLVATHIEVGLSW
jgi:hypothetical protein